MVGADIKHGDGIIEFQGDSTSEGHIPRPNNNQKQHLRLFIRILRC